MKLWILRPITGRPEWTPWYDKAFGFVVQAETEAQAREIAKANGGAEGHTTWMNPNTTTCKELAVEGIEAKLVMVDFQAA